MRKLALAVLLLLSACAQSTPVPVILTTEPTHTFTPSPVPSGTPLPTETPIPTATPFQHPMSIETLRQGSYPGSDIILEKELERGANYRRYYAYYLSEGLKIYGLLTVPDGEMPAGGWPAIVFNHGYIPPEIYKTTERYTAYVDKIARSGYIVFRIDYRGHDQSEGEATGAYGNPGYLVDVMNAVASIKKFPQANPEKIGMWGHSMGGFLTLRAMVISKDVKVGVIWAGVVGSYPDLVYKWRRTGAAVTPSPSSQGRGWRTGWLEQYGTPEQNPAFWKAVSANSYLADLSGLIQILHGTADEDVPVAFSETLYGQIRAAGQYAELYTYPGDNHNISTSFDTAMAQTIAFYDTYLK